MNKFILIAIICGIVLAAVLLFPRKGPEGINVLTENNQMKASVVESKKRVDGSSGN